MEDIKYCYYDNTNNLYVSFGNGKEFYLRNDKFYNYHTGEFSREATKEEIDYIEEEVALPF